MKRSICFFALSLVATLGCRSSSTAQSLDSLRKIKVERQMMLTLGDEMPQPADFCNWKESTCTLKPGTFGGAQGMSVTKNKSGLVARFYFNYGVMSLEAVKAQVDDYTRLLGKPSRDSITKIGDSNVRAIQWSDPRTSFELSYDTNNNAVSASATLTDNTSLTGKH